MKGSIVGGKYKLDRLLGRGGMGEVHEATHMSTGRRVAIKLLTQSNVTGDEDDTERKEEVIARFAREARAAGQIDSPHVVEVLDAGVDLVTHRPFMVMEYLTGEDLQHVLKRTGPLALGPALRITAQALSGLARAHASGVVHRDIKPANLFLARHENKLQVKVVDFGIARVEGKNDGQGDITQDLTRTGSMLGSPTYMAPEQARGLRQIDARVDIWSLGIVLYKMLTGRTPHERGDGGLGELLIAICCVPAPPVQDFAPWVPAEVAAVVERALTIDVTKRYASADEMYSDVAKLIHGGSLEIDADDLVTGIPENDKSYIAPRADDGPSATYKSLNSIPIHDGTIVDATRMTMGSGSIPRELRPPAKTSARTIGLIGAVLALTVAIGGVAWQRAHPEKPVLGTIAPIAAAPSVTSKATASVVIPKTVSVKIPSGTTVEVDGTAVSVDGDHVTFEGAIGSEHKLRMTKGSDSKTLPVYILDTGAKPDEAAFDKKLGMATNGAAPVVLGASTTAKSVQTAAAIKPPQPSGMVTKFE